MGPQCGGLCRVPEGLRVDAAPQTRRPGKRCATSHHAARRWVPLCSLRHKDRIKKPSLAMDWSYNGFMETKESRVAHPAKDASPKRGLLTLGALRVVYGDIGTSP